MAKKHVPYHKKKRHKVAKLFSRTTLIILAFLAQVVLLGFALYYMARYFYTYFLITYIISLLLIIVILFKNQEQTYKIAWIVTIVIIPVIGTLIYLFVQLDYYPRLLKKHYLRNTEKMHGYLENKDDNLEELGKIDSRYKGVASYLQNIHEFPTYRPEALEYYPSGEASLDDILSSLRSAEKFINIEFFIIKDGIFWKKVIDILVEKAEQGVEVRFLYDGLNEMFNVPRNLPRRLKKVGIEARVFSPTKSSSPHRENYRNHRKSIVVDGKVAFVGGINLADEYINEEERFGYWKDAVLRVEGEAVNAITLMFFTMWNLREKEDFDCTKYLREENENYLEDSFVIPYGDSPFLKDIISYNIYLEIINKATKYVYICSPYLVLTREFTNALVYASRRGVDVRLLMPGIPDKKIPFLVARTYYKQLINAGIKIYEYTKGFNHSKLFVSDDIVFTVGSTNLDYRSFFLSFENGVLGINKDIALDIKEDLLKAYKESQLIDLETYKKFSKWSRFWGQIFRIFIPLL
ncbi:MAG: cardiolipin synthase [Bacilli bacterium]|jgi:cardiolipin synthase